MKILFLAQIPSYDTIQTSLYRIRRQFIPPAPSSQTDLDANLDWCLVSRNPDESLIKGDIVHSDGLRVLLFSTDESLSILARSSTILCDWTFHICPYLWYQVFIVSAEFRENSFVPVSKKLTIQSIKHKCTSFSFFVGDPMMISSPC